GPQVRREADGALLDQNDNGIPGEDPGDRYIATFILIHGPSDAGRLGSDVLVQPDFVQERSSQTGAVTCEADGDFTTIPVCSETNYLHVNGADSRYESPSASCNQSASEHPINGPGTCRRTPARSGGELAGRIVDNLFADVMDLE